jgi:hypothetical protein
MDLKEKDMKVLARFFLLSIGSSRDFREHKAVLAACFILVYCSAYSSTLKTKKVCLSPKKKLFVFVRLQSVIPQTR